MRRFVYDNGKNEGCFIETTRGYIEVIINSDSVRK